VTFDVVMVCKFFDVLFGSRCCEIGSSDLFPFCIPLDFLEISFENGSIVIIIIKELLIAFFSIF